MVPVGLQSCVGSRKKGNRKQIIQTSPNADTIGLKLDQFLDELKHMD